MLKIWLPLDGNLENKGCSNVTATQIETPTYVAGKIGQCYQRANSNSQLTNGINLNSNLLDILGTQASVAVWVKPLGTHTHYNGTILSSGNWNAQKWAFGVSQDNSQVDVLCGGYNNYITCAVPVNEWTHLVSTFNNGVCKLYKNGVYVGEKTGQAAFVSDATWTGVGRESYAGGYFGFNGCINDLRIYNHCLSAAEVKEIAQGLVLHYKLDGFQGGYGNPNLALGSQTLSTTATVSNTYISKRGAAILGTRDGFAQVNGTAAWQGFSLWSNSLNLQVGTTYTYSFYAYTALSTSTNAGISFYPMMYNSAGTRDTTSKLPISVMGGTLTEVNSKQIGVLNTTPKLYWATFTWNQTMANILTNGGKIELSIQIHGTFNEGRIDYLWAPKLEIGNTPTNWSPAASEGFLNIIQDSSGYGHNGTIVGDFILNSETKRYSYSTKWNSSSPTTSDETGICYIQTPITLTAPLQMSITWWAKPENGYGGSTGHGALCTSTNTSRPTDYNTTAFHHRDSGFDIYPSDASGVKRLSFTYTKNEWHHYALTYDGTTARAYQDGVEKTTVTVGTNKTLATFTQLYIGYSQAGGVKRKTLGSYSDFRIYCTALSADDILALYHTGAKIDNQGAIHSYEFIEQQANIFFPIELSRTNFSFTNGLSRYTQSNCQVTLSEEGYHIYRPPNLTTSANGNTMFGGLKLVNQTSDTVSPYSPTRDNIWNLQKEHSYIIAFHVKGQSSNTTNYLSFNNNMGWGVGGVAPAPTVIASSTIPTNFQGEKDCFYAFTINDDIVKTSNDARAGYDGSSQYLSYRHFTCGWTYTDTGALGTDIYLTNFRLYDITNITGKIKKNGQASFSDFVENNSIARILKNAEFLTNNLIEL